MSLKPESPAHQQDSGKHHFFFLGHIHDFPALSGVLFCFYIGSVFLGPWLLIFLLSTAPNSHLGYDTWCCSPDSELSLSVWGLNCPLYSGKSWPLPLCTQPSQIQVNGTGEVLFSHFLETGTFISFSSDVICHRSPSVPHGSSQTVAPFLIYISSGTPFPSSFTPPTQTHTHTSKCMIYHLRAFV